MSRWANITSSARGEAEPAKLQPEKGGDDIAQDPADKAQLEDSKQPSTDEGSKDFDDHCLGQAAMGSPDDRIGGEPCGSTHDDPEHRWIRNHSCLP